MAKREAEEGTRGNGRNREDRKNISAVQMVADYWRGNA